MAKIKEDISIRSEEVQDIMSRIPNSLIRYGLGGMLLLLIMGIFLSWFIKYPEIIKGKLILTTTLEPIKMVSQSSGIIKHLYAKDGDLVNEGMVLAEIENPITADDAEYLQKYLNKLEKTLKGNASVLPLPDTSLISLGELQTVVNDLTKELITYNISASLKINDAEIASTKSKIENQKKMIAVNERIITITKKEVDNSKVKFEADEKLYKEGFISKMDYLQSETSLRDKELSLEQMNQSMINQKSLLNALELQYKQSEFSKFSKDKTNLDAIRGYIKNIRAYVYGWQQKFNLIAMKSGRVDFLQRIKTGNFIKAGEELFAITEPGGAYIGVAQIPMGGYGKVKTGQDVNILLQNFPYYEYGMIHGKVRNISLFPSTDEYRVEIALPNGMMSTTKVMLNYTPEMSGDAEIITDNKRIIERMFESITKALKRK